MTARSVFSTFGAALGGVVGLVGPGPQEADAQTLRRLLGDLGVDARDDRDLDAAIRRFQRRTGLADDGVAGPRTVHLLVRYAAEARDLRGLGLAG